MIKTTKKENRQQNAIENEIQLYELTKYITSLIFDRSLKFEAIHSKTYSKYISNACNRTQKSLSNKFNVLSYAALVILLILLYISYSVCSFSHCYSLFFSHSIFSSFFFAVVVVAAVSHQWNSIHICCFFIIRS